MPSVEPMTPCASTNMEVSTQDIVTNSVEGNYSQGVKVLVVVGGVSQGAQFQFGA